MPAQQIRHRKQNVVNFEPGNPESEKLKTGFVFRELYIRLDGKVNISSAGTAGSAPLNPEGIIKRLELVIDGNTTLRSFDGHALRDFTKRMYNTRGERITVDESATGDQEFTSYMVIPLWMPKSMRPIDTAVDSSPFNSFEVQITWGDLADIVGDATATWVNEPTVSVRSLESFGVKPPGNQWRSYNQRSKITAANDALQIPLKIGEAYRGFHIRTMSGNPQQPARDVLNNLKLVSGSEVYADLDESDLANIDLVRKDQDSIVPGYYFLDLVTDGMLTETLDTNGFSEIYLELDVNAPTNAQLDLWPQLFLPVRGEDGGGKGGGK